MEEDRIYFCDEWNMKPSDVIEKYYKVLDNEGIPYLFQNENLVSVNPLASYAYGGIQLKVHPKDFELVQEILNNLNTNLEIV